MSKDDIDVHTKIVERLYVLLDVHDSLERLVTDPGMRSQYNKAIVHEEAWSIEEIVTHEIAKQRDEKVFNDPGALRVSCPPGSVRIPIPDQGE